MQLLNCRVRWPAGAPPEGGNHRLGPRGRVTQRSQLRHSVRQAERAKVEALYNEFVTESARLLGDALTHQKDDIADMVGLYALVGRMRLMSPRPVVTAAEQIVENIIETYIAPNRSLHEMIAYVKEGRMNLLPEFTEACRQDLVQRYQR